MQTFFIEQETDYTGEELSSHWIYRKTGKPGDAIAAFIGGCSVSLAHMVDLEDVFEKKSIFSRRMLHFLVEHFDQRDLEKAVLRQRLLVTLLREMLEGKLPQQKFLRRGDDLYLDGRKMTVSIATISPVSSLIHLGVNISSRETPVPAVGLEDLGLDAKELAQTLMERYQDETASVEKARCKVKAVG